MRLPHSVAYWHRNRLVTRRWFRPSTGVLWVTLARRRMQGMDNYWVADDCYGMFNDPENFARYDGPQAISWAYRGGVETERFPAFPPANATFYVGLMLADDDASTVGLL